MEHQDEPSQTRISLTDKGRDAVDLARAHRELAGEPRPVYDPVYPDDPDEPLPIKLVA